MTNSLLMAAVMVVLIITSIVNIKELWPKGKQYIFLAACCTILLILVVVDIVKGII